MGTSASISFRILKISKSHTSMSLKIMMLKYIGRYLQEKCRQKSPVKKYIVFWELQKDKFLIANSSKVVVK
jgi:hypothetical protein